MPKIRATIKAQSKQEAIRMKTKLLAILTALALTACAVTTPVEIIGGTVLVSDNIDSMQVDIGEYSENQDIIKELDELQAEILTAISTGDGAIDVNLYYDRALFIYAVLKAEAVDRHDEMTQNQWARLSALDNQLVALNDKVLLFKQDLESSGFNLDLIYSATALIKLYKLL